MSKYADVSFSYEHEDQDGDVIETFEVEARVFWYKENYGEDADGNRGEERIEVEDVKLTQVLSELGIKVPINELPETIIESMNEKAEAVFYDK